MVNRYDSNPLGPRLKGSSEVQGDDVYAADPSTEPFVIHGAFSQSVVSTQRLVQKRQQLLLLLTQRVRMQEVWDPIHTEARMYLEFKRRI